MGGGYIRCAEFEGDDKSGSPSFAVLKTVLHLTDSDLTEPSLFRKLFTKHAAPSKWVVVLRQFRGRAGVVIPSELARELLPPVETYYRHLGEELGHPEPGAAPDLDKAAGLDIRKAKWGSGPGPGWRYYCAHDLVAALQKSIATGQPVNIEFD